MKKSNVIPFYLIVFMVMYVVSFAQIPDISWSRIYPEYHDDVGWVIREAAKGYYIGGSSWNQPRGDRDIYLMHINYSGDMQWDRYYGGAGYDVAYGMDVIDDDGFILTGYSNSGGTFLLRVNQNGDSLWLRTYDPLGAGRSVIATSDGGYLAVGSTGNDAAVLKTDYVGNVIWYEVFGQPEYYWAEAFSVCETSDGAYAVVGYVEVPGPEEVNVWLLKLDQSGDTLWTAIYGGPSGDGGDWIEETSDGGFIIVGRSVSPQNGSWDVYLIKTDQNGNMVWDRTYGGDYWDGAHSVQETPSGGFMIGAYSQLQENGMSFYLINTDSYGNELWSTTLGDTGIQWGISSIITSDGGYIMVGPKWVDDYNYDDIMVVKWGAVLTDVYEIELTPTDMVASINSIYPNPFNANTSIKYSLAEKSKISLSIYNILGQRVETLLEGIQDPGEHALTWNASEFPSGVYFARLESAGRAENIKMVLLK